MRKNKNFFSNEENISLINWKSVELLKRYVTRFGDIKPSKYNGNTVKYQKRVRQAIIRARELGVIEYIK